MKKYLMMLMVLAAFAIPGGALADSDEDHDNGIGNDGSSSQVDEGASGHIGEEPQ